MQYVKTNWLDAADSIGVTAPEQVHGASRYGIHRVTTGGPTSVGLSLEGSLDGSTWFTIMSADGAGTPIFKWSEQYPNPVGPVTYIRLNLSTLSGGTSPTVTASVVATD